MSYQLHCKTCGADISPLQYDTFMGECGDCHADAWELDEGEDPDDADQFGLANMPHQ